MNNLVYRIIRKILIKTTTRGKARKVHFGVIKGMNWVYSSGYSEYYMGTYEREVAEEFFNYSKKCNVIYDIGANIGYYTLIASKATKQEGKVYSFEPLPRNLPDLEKNIRCNKNPNIKILDYAVSDTTAKLNFSNSDNNVANTLCLDSPMFNEGKSIIVEAVKLDDLVQSGKIAPPGLIKMDVEGAELQALIGAEKTLIQYHPVIFLSTHNCQIPGIHKKCCDYLTQLGYSLRYLNFRENKTENDDPWYEVLAEYK